VADWILVPCLVALRGEFNAIAPERDKTTDGSIGDLAHRKTNSDHNPDEESDALRDHDADSKNEVHAIDVDKDLRVPDLSMEEVVQHLVRRCRSGAEKRLRYIIYNRRIWSPIDDWAQRPYSGANAHTAHAHFSASYDTRHESDTSTWHLEDLVAITDAEIEKIAARVEQRVWNHTEPNPYDNGATNRRMGGDLRMMEYRDDTRAEATNITRLDNQVIPMLREVLAGQVAIAGKVDALDVIDEQDRAAIAALVLAGLPTEAIAAALAVALPPELAQEVVAHLLSEINRRTAPDAGGEGEPQ
jgi:hypothetical protein